MKYIMSREAVFNILALAVGVVLPIVDLIVAFPA
jgi:hypothetical protein